MSPPASLSSSGLWKRVRTWRGRWPGLQGKRPFYNRQAETSVYEDQAVITVDWESEALVLALHRLLCDLSQGSLPLWCSFPPSVKFSSWIRKLYYSFPLFDIVWFH